MEYERQKKHKRNEQLEQLLQEINGLLAPAEAQVVYRYEKTRHPVILIMGSPRSGTTLLLQWLAASGSFSYPTNILSRFYAAPHIGAKIQLMLTRHDFNGEIFDFKETTPYTSNLGKTTGALAPNEFWYFWRRFFHFGEIQRLDDQALSQVDSGTFSAELAAIEAVFGQPFAMKGMIANWNIPFIDKILEKVLFISIRRKPFFNIQSLLEARVNYYGDEGGWYSFKPPEYPSLARLSPCEQVAGQIYYTNRAIEEGLREVGESRKLEIRYEDLCQNPEAVFEQIADKLRTQGSDGPWTYRGERSFRSAESSRMDARKTEEVVAAYRDLSGEEIKTHV